MMLLQSLKFWALQALSKPFPSVSAESGSLRQLASVLRAAPAGYARPCCCNNAGADLCIKEAAMIKGPVPHGRFSIRSLHAWLWRHWMHKTSARLCHELCQIAGVQLQDGEKPLRNLTAILQQKGLQPPCPGHSRPQSDESLASSTQEHLGLPPSRRWKSRTMHLSFTVNHLPISLCHT